MTTRRWLIIMAVAGLAIFALSFVNLWLFHDREVRGEGYRFVQIVLSAWRGQGAVGVLTAGVVLALVVGIGAALAALGVVRVPAAVLLIGSTLVLGLVASALWPVSRLGFASDVHLSPAWLVPVGIALALAMVVAAVAIARPPAMLATIGAIVVLVAFGGGAAGRSWLLDQSSNDNQFWSEGSYARAAAGDQPAEVLTIDGQRVTINDRWSGTWETSGWAASIEDDPACPDVRGTYHVHDAGDGAIRFVKIIDTCRDGERAADLETGIWERDS